MAASSKPVKSSTHDGTVGEVVPARIVAQARKLLTGAEKKFFNSSFGAALTKHTHAQVEAAVKQARLLRNKWRDLHQGQSRTAKRAGRSTDKANVRTREKHDILAGVVARFEKRLAELKALVGAEASPAVKRTAKPAARIPSAKPVRPVVAKPSESKRTTRKVAVRLGDTPAAQVVRFDRAKQRSASTAAKASRILRGGQGTQRLGHTVAAGRRAQRRRDIHSRG